MPTETLPAVPFSLGSVTSRNNQIVSVEFADIEANPTHLRGGTRQFKVDIGKQGYRVGDWVVASWKRAPRTDKATGAFLVQGAVGAGCRILPVVNAVAAPGARPQPFTEVPHNASLRSLPGSRDDAGVRTFLEVAARQLASQLEKRTSAPQDKPQGPDPTAYLSVVDPTVSPAAAGPPPPWLPVPVSPFASELEWSMPESYIRIGYVSFTVDSPVEEIRIEELSPTQSIQTLRSRTPIQKDNWHAQRQVTIALTLHGLEAINEVLLPLVRLFKKAPFLPVFNHLLFDADITALTLQSLQTSTIPGYPNALKAVLVCWSFNWETYLPLAREAHGLDSLFCYPLLKIWAEKPYSHAFSPKKIARQWDGEFHMYHPSEDWLKQVNEFPSIADRAHRLNDDLDALDLAALWSQDIQPIDRTGFRQTYANGNQKILSLNLAAGRALVSPYDGEFQPSPYTFLRITDPAMARKIASSPDCIKVLKGSVKIRLVVPALAGPTQGTPTLVDVDEVIGGGAGLVDLLDKGDKITLDYLRAGNYTFMVHMHSPLFRSLAQQRRPKQPVKPPDDPVRDNGHEFSPPSFVIEQLSCSMDNLIVPLQVGGKTHATHQYMGSNCLSFQVIGTLQNYSDLSQIQNFMERVHELGRDYKGTIDGKPFGGFCLVENEIFHLMGARHVLPIAWEATTVPDFPEALRVSITLVEFDITQRRREVLDNLTKGYEKNPLQSIRSEHDPISAYYVRQGQLNERLRALELYPDLALPTHSELAVWIKAIQEDRVWDWQNVQAYPGYEYLDPENGGSGWHWSQDEQVNDEGTKIADRLPHTFLDLKLPVTHPDRFADPDFYCAPAQKWGVELVEGMVDGSKAHPVLLSDSYGTQVEILPGEHLDEHLVRRKGRDPQNTLGDGQSAIDNESHPPPIGASTSLVDDLLWGKIQGVSLEQSNVVSDPTSQAVRSGKALLIPSVPSQNNLKQGGTRPRVAVDNGGTLADRYNRYAPVAAAAAEYYNVPKDIFFGQIEQESGWNSAARNSAGRGIAQIEPAAQQDLGLTDAQIWDPNEALFGAARYLRRQLNAFHGDVNLALAAYNEGAGATRTALRKTGRPTDKGTAYASAVRARATRYVSAPNAPTGLGATAGWLAQPGVDPLIRVQKRQMQQQQNAGSAYKGEALAPYIIPDEAGDTPVERFFNNLEDKIRGTHGGVSPATDPFIKKFWLKPLGGSEAAPAAYQVRPEFLEEFLTECKRRHLNLSIITDPADATALVGLHQYDHSYDDLPYHPPTIQQSFHDPAGQHDIWHDLREELICGRLLGAFPTFYVAVIDGGRRLRIYRMFDHLYGMQAVTQIAVHRTRKGPVETAVVNFSNMYGHLTAQGADQSRFNSRDTRGTWGLEAVWRGFQSFVKIDDETLVEWAQAVETLFLKPGARLHIRMGYGSDCSMLPVVFNGVISEVPLSEGEVQVVALSDGIELTNDLAPTDLQGSVPVTRLNSWFGEGANPREIITTFMAPNPALATMGNLLGTTFELYGLSTLGNLLYDKTPNAYGIEHFGSPVRSPFGFDDGEIGTNLYNPESSAPYTNSSAWDNTMRVFQFWRWDKNKGLIGINMAQATPWQIFETCRKSVPDYLLYAAPFETRSTLFFGKGWFPLFYRYKEGLPEFTPDALTSLPREQLMEWKPFQQVHLVSSDWNLIRSDVRADDSGVATQVQAIGTYNGWLPGSSDLSNEASFVMMVDSDIWKEKQKLKVVESGLYADVNMKLGDTNSDEGGGLRVGLGAIMTALGIATLNPLVAIGGLASLAEGPVRSFLFSRRVEDFFAAATLKDYVKDMYQGPLTMLGSPSIKPFDLLSVADNLTGLNGMCETKAVTHVMSLETGFVTVAQPDCIATFMDVEGRDLYMWADMTSSHLLGGIAMAAALGTLARRGSKAVTLRTIRRLSKWVDSEVKRLANGLEPTSELFQKMPLAEAQEVANDLKFEVDQVVQAVQQGNTTKLRELIAAITDKNAAATTAASAGKASARQILDAAPKDVQFELHVQRAIQGGLLESKAGQLTSQKAKELSTLLKQKGAEITETNFEELDRLTAELEKKHGELAGLGRTEEELAGLAKRVKKGERLTTADEAAAKLYQEVAGLEKGWKVQNLARSTINTIPETTELLASVGKQIFARANIFAALVGIGSIALGGLSDYITRVMVARQCLTIYSLKVYGLNLEAGINGHRGAVAGDRLGTLDAYLQGTIEFWGRPYLNLIAPFIPILGDIVTSGINYRAPALPSFIDSNTRALGGG